MNLLTKKLAGWAIENDWNKQEFDGEKERNWT
jgi:hypothetical protein